MRVSVIVPTYYRPHDLAMLLNSLLEQIVKPMEVIIVDDTPTAAIRNLVEEYEIAFKNLEVALFYVRNPKERSTSIARNVGAKMARCDILLFLDSDVVVYADYIRELLETFEENSEAVGIAGWIIPCPRHEDIRYYLIEAIKKSFSLFHDSKDSCNFPEYPIILTKTVTCQWFSGSNMAWRRDVFDEFQFDESLKGYAFMEDVLFSGLVYGKHRGRLLMTPNAKCIHTASNEGRPEESKLKYRKIQNRKYVLTRLFGTRGLLMFGWQNLGLLVIRLIRSIRKESAIPDQFL